MSTDQPRSKITIGQAMMFGGIGGAAFGLFEVLDVVFRGRLGLGPMGAAMLLVPAAAFPGVLGAVAGATFVRLRPGAVVGRFGLSLVGLSAAIAAALAIFWFSDPPPFADPLPLQGNPVAFSGMLAALAVVTFAIAVASAGRAWLRAAIAAILIGTVAVMIWPPLAERSDVSQGPNVLFVTLDTTRADRFGEYPIDTAAYDRVAAEGARFDLAISQIPVTGPSHATMMLGMPPWEHQVMLNGRPVPEERRMLAEELRDRGYRTAAFVSAYVLHGNLGFARGFDVYDDDFGILKGVGRTLPGRAWEMLLRRDEGHVLERRGDRTVDAALSWLEQAEREPGPFFAWVHLFDAHGPYAPPSPYDQRYYGGGDPRDPSNQSMERVASVPPYMAGTLEGITDAAWPIAQYDGEVAFADDQLERLLTWLDDRRVAQGTLVIVCGDHGEGLGEEGEWFNHGDWLFDHDLHVPLAIRFPGRIQPGTVVREPVELTDLAPTVLGMLGLEPLEQHHGIDLEPTISAGRHERLVAGSVAFDREANRAARERDPGFKPTFRMASVRGPDDRLTVREAPQYPTRYWHLGREVTVIPDPEQVKLKSWLESRARELLTTGPIVSSVSEADRALLESLGYIEDVPEGEK